METKILKAQDGLLKIRAIGDLLGAFGPRTELPSAETVASVGLLIAEIADEAFQLLDRPASGLQVVENG